MRGFPEDITKIFNALRDENRSRIFLTIYERNQRNLSFSDLKKELKLNSNTLANALTVLQEAQLVNNVLMKIDNRSDYSFYEVTDFGKKFIEAIINFIENIVLDIKHPNITNKSDFGLPEEEIKMMNTDPLYYSKDNDSPYGTTTKEKRIFHLNNRSNYL